MSVASVPTASSEHVPLPEARRTLVAAGVNHALHDGYTDLIYVLLPVWQAEFGLDYVALAFLRSLYNGALAALQMPASRLAQAWGARTVLVLGTGLSAAGYAVAGASGGLVGLGIGLLLGGAGSSTQHPPGLGGDRPGLRTRRPRPPRHLQFHRRSRESGGPAPGRPPADPDGVAARALGDRRGGRRRGGGGRTPAPA